MFWPGTWLAACAPRWPLSRRLLPIAPFGVVVPLLLCLAFQSDSVPPEIYPPYTCDLTQTVIAPVSAFWNE